MFFVTLYSFALAMSGVAFLQFSWATAQQIKHAESHEVLSGLIKRERVRALGASLLFLVLAIIVGVGADILALP